MQFRSTNKKTLNFETATREAVKERDQGLEAMRSAYHKEVIQVKEEVVKNMTHKGAMVEDMEEVISRGFDLHLLAEPLGKGWPRLVLCFFFGFF